LLNENVNDKNMYVDFKLIMRTRYGDWLVEYQNKKCYLQFINDDIKLKAGDFVKAKIEAERSYNAFGILLIDRVSENELADVPLSVPFRLHISKQNWD